MLHINKSRANFIFVKKLFSGLGFLPLLCWIMMYSGGCDNNSPVPNPYPSGLYVTGMQIDNKNVNVNSFAQVFNVSLRPNPLASISFSQPVSSIIDSIKKNLSIVHDKDKSLVAFTLRQSGNDSIVYIDLAAGAFLDRSKLYEITLKRGFYVQIVANTYSLIRSYSVKFSTVSKSNNTNLSVNYLGNDIVASDAGVFTIDTSFTTLPERIPLKLRVDPSSSVDEGNTKLSSIDGSIDYVFDVNSALNERRFIVTAEDGGRKEYTIVVKASASKYTVSFNTNGGSSIPRVETPRGGAVNRPPDPTRAGFTFNNWYSNSALTTLYDFSATVMENLELYAKWDTVKSSTYTVAFNTNGGSSILSQTIDSGSAAIRPSTPRRAGYRFNNWYSDLALTTVYDFSAAVSSNLTLYAKWDTVRYTVSFNTNGGGSILSQTIDSGRAAVRPPDPTRAHFTFNNWYSNSAFTTPYNFSTPVTGDLTLYVKWDTVKYTVTFNPNNGSAGSLKIVHSGDTVPIPLSPMKKDSVFERWYSDANLTMVYNFGTAVTSNFSLYAKWVFRPLTAADTATVTFNTNVGSAISSVKTRKGNAITKPPAPTRTGYRFNNWYSDLALMTVYDFSSAVSSDLTLYAKWDTVKYTVTFNTNSGSAVSAQNVDSGGLAARPTNPMRTGYRFNAWYSDINLTLIYDFSSPVSADITLYAKWDTVKYTVSFNTNGGGSISSQTIDSSGLSVRPASDPTRTHFTFNNWYSDAGLTTTYDFSKAVKENLTIYAKWDTVKYTVTFNPNNGSPAYSKIINSGDTVPIPLSPTKTDSVFEKWYSDAALTTAYDFSSVVTSNFSLYAKWESRPLTAADTATVTFSSNSGSAVASVKTRKGNAIARPTDPTRAGYTFNAWYSDAGLTAVYDFTAVVTVDITLYAKWDTVKYTVAFNSNGGSAVDSQRVNSSGSAVRPTNPTRTNFTFNNWYSNSTLTTVYNFSSAVTSDITLYAKWDTIKYTVTFNSNSGSAVNVQSVPSGDTAVRPTNPTRTHYTFNDWYIDAALTTPYDFGTTITSNATLYAKWDTIKYTVTFNSNSGSSVGSQTIKSGNTAVRPTNPTRTHYTFNDWYSDAILTTAYSFSSAVTSDMTLYAKWDTIKYTVAFNSNSGSAVNAQSVPSGDTAVRPTNPTRTHFMFSDWYSDAGLTTAYDFGTTITSNATLYAKWDTVKYTVTFNSNSGGAVSAQTINSGDTAASPSDPTRMNFTFRGWYNNVNLTTAYDFSKAVTGDLTLYAKWTPIYTIKFTVIDGTPVDSIRIDSGFIAQEPAYPTYTGSGEKYFGGWVLESNQRIPFVFSSPVVSNLSLRARWTGLFGSIIYSRKMPDVLPITPEVLMNKTLGNGNYKEGAEVIPIYVKAGAAARGDGSSWSKAMPNLKTVMADITNANANRIYVVLVAASGTAYGHGGEILMKKNVAILGGFAAANDTDLTQSSTAVTTLRGDLSPRAYESVLSGTGSNLADERSSLLYRVTVFDALGYNGGGIELNSFSPTITDVVINANGGRRGGGMYILGSSSPLVQNTIFSNNKAIPVANNNGGEGGGVYMTGTSSPIFVNCSFFKNLTQNGASSSGAIYSGVREGGGISALNSSSLTLINCVFLENNSTLSTTGNALHLKSTGTHVVVNTIFSNTASTPSSIPQDVYLIRGNIIMSNGYIEGGQASIKASAGANVYYNIIDMTTVNPGIGTLANNGGPVRTISIPSGSSAVNLGLYAKVSRATTPVPVAAYFSKDNIAWFTYSTTGEETPVTPPADAINVNENDARSYGRIDKPDAGVFEADATP